MKVTCLQREKQSRTVSGRFQVHTGWTKVLGSEMEGRTDAGPESPLFPPRAGLPFQREQLEPEIAK